jgi:hypothetical protein
MRRGKRLLQERLRSDGNKKKRVGRKSIALKNLEK